MLTIIRIIFFAAFVLTVGAGIGLRMGWVASAIAMGCTAAAIVAGVAISVESRFARAIGGYRRPVMYGAIAGWIIGFLVRTLLLELTACSAMLDPLRAAVLMLAFIWLGAVMACLGHAFRSDAGNYHEAPKLEEEDDPGSGSRGAWWKRITWGATPTGQYWKEFLKAARSITFALWLFIVACVIYYSASAANEVYPPKAFLVPLAVLMVISVVALVAGRRLVRFVAEGLPVVLFALAMAGPTFAIFSVGTSLNEWMRLEAQQAAMVILWGYVGAAFTIGD